MANSDPVDRDAALMVELSKISTAIAAHTIAISQHDERDQARFDQIDARHLAMSQRMGEICTAVDRLSKEHEQLEDRTLKVETVQGVDLATRANEGDQIKKVLTRAALESLDDVLDTKTGAKKAETETTVEQKKAETTVAVDQAATKNKLAIQIAKVVGAILLMVISSVLTSLIGAK